MNRLAMSVVSGIIIPILYTAIIGPLSLYIQSRQLNEVLGYPVRWPIHLLEFIVFSRWSPFSDIDEIFALVFVLFCNVFVYSVLTYTLLHLFWKRKPQLDLPPEPPRFSQQ